MAHLTISLLGPYEVKLDGIPVTGFPSRKVRALLAYLAVEADHPHRRDTLAGLLWPDYPERSARTNLSNALSNLRTAIRDREAKPFYLHINREAVQFNVASDQQVDVRKLAAALVSEGGDEGTIRRLGRAVDMYRGPFLDGFSLDDSPPYDDWAYLMRERTARQVLEALRRLAAYHERQGAYRQACEYAWRQVELEPWQEEAHRALMRLLALSGQRGAALAQYEACRRALRAELDVEPGEATTQLYQRIRHDELAGRQQMEKTILGPPPADRAAASVPHPPVALATPIRSLESQRRVVTVLLAQVSGTAKLLDELGTERWAEMVSRLLRELKSQVRRYDGEIEPHRSDGFLAFFGITVAHEDDAERAVLAALAMQDAMDRFAASALGGTGPKLDLRVAIHTGELIVTCARAASGDREGTTVGPAIDVAQHVGTLAEPGTALVTEPTHRLVRTLFEWGPSGQTAVPGADEPLALYRPLAARVVEDKGRGIPGLSSPMVGREAELSALQEAVARLGAGVGGIVTLVGEAGLGKSRLVAEVRQQRDSHRESVPHTRHPAPTAQWMEGRCLSYATGVAYHLWLDVLHEMLGVLPDALPGKVREALRKQVRSLCPDAYGEVYPFLGRLLSLPLEERLRAQLRGLGPEGLKAATYRAVETLVERASRQGPIVLVCEDLHWADPTSLELLIRLFDLTDRAPLLLLCVFRPETEHGCWAVKETASRRYPHRHTDLWLEPLSPADARALIGNLLQVEDLPEALRANILKPAEGNPFYVEEILRSLMEDGMIYRDESAGCWVGHEDLDQVTLPNTLNGVLMARIDRLPGETRQVLQIASVIGRVFGRRVLARVTEDGDGLDAHLLTLQRRQMIRERARLLDVEYVFKHVLTQEAAYNSLLSTERRRYHRDTAEAVEAIYADRIAEHIGRLAHHWEQAAQPEKAIAYLLRAADQARLAYANEEAIGYYRRTFALLEHLPADLDQAAWRLDALRGLGTMYHRTGKLSDAECCFRKAVAIAQDAQLDLRERLRLYHALGQVLYWQGRYDERVQIGEEGLALLGADARSAEAALMLQTLAGAYWMKRELDTFQKLALRMAEFLAELPYEPQLRPAYLSIMDLYRFFERDMERADQWRQTLERYARQQHDLTGLATAYSYGARFCMAQGDLRRALSHYQQAAELCLKVGDAKESYLVQDELAATCLRLGDLDGAEAYIRAARETAQASWSDDVSAGIHVDVGYILLCRHQWEAAAAAFRSARQAYQELGDAGGEVSATLLLARTHLAQANREGAQRELGTLSARVTPGERDLNPYDVASVLGAVEEAFEGREDVLAFLRRPPGEPEDPRWRESLQEPAIQWLLEPADPAPHGQTLYHDGFAGVLSPGWTWRDPFEDCSFEVRDGLEIYAANGRGLARLNTSAPGLLRLAPGDWVVQTACGPLPKVQLPDLGGLLVWVDEQNYLSLLKGIDGKHEISFWGCLDGRDLYVGRGHLVSRQAPGAAETVYLRLERDGAHVRALCSADGMDWYAVGETAFSVRDTVQVGPVAIGDLDRAIYPGAYPEGTAIRFTSFDLWTLPRSSTGAMRALRSPSAT